MIDNQWNKLTGIVQGHNSFLSLRVIYFIISAHSFFEVDSNNGLIPPDKRTSPNNGPYLSSINRE
jgi:hypothetical protein